jgi:membrane protease YdiL (CAAX protease family)
MSKSENGRRQRTRGARKRRVVSLTAGWSQSDTHSGISIHFGQKEKLIEVFIFLFLIVPSLVLSFSVTKPGALSFVLVSSVTILRDLALVSLVLFFLWHNREHVIDIGWTLRNGWKEVGLGIGLFIPLFFGVSALESALQAAGLSVSSTPLPALVGKRGVTEFLLAFILVIVVALAEETSFRGYLILRFKAITQSPAASILLSSAIFSLGHGYEGSAGVVTVGVIGAFFALVYLWRQSLVAPIVMHFLQDFIGIVLDPLLGMK